MFFYLLSLSYTIGGKAPQLVGGIPTPPKNMKVNWDNEIPNIWKSKSHVPVTTNQTSMLSVESIVHPIRPIFQTSCRPLALKGNPLTLCSNGQFFLLRLQWGTCTQKTMGHAKCVPNYNPVLGPPVLVCIVWQLPEFLRMPGPPGPPGPKRASAVCTRRLSVWEVPIGIRAEA